MLGDGYAFFDVLEMNTGTWERSEETLTLTDDDGYVIIFTINQ